MNRVRWYWYRLVQRGKVLLIFSQMLLLALAEKYDEQAEQQTDDYDAHLAIINDQFPYHNLGLFQQIKPVDPVPPFISQNILDTKFLVAQTPIKFYYVMPTTSRGFSVTVVPCTARINWSLHYRNERNTGKFYDIKYPEEKLTEYTGDNTKTFITNYAELGVYTIEITALDEDTYVQYYLTLESEGPGLLQLEQEHQTVHFRKRQFKDKLGIRWSESHIDPHLIKYYVVINTRKFYKSICEARSEIHSESDYALVAPVGSSATKNVHDDVIIQTVGHSTNYTITDVTYGKRYYVNVFAINVTDFSVPLANGSVLYQKRKPRTLKDGRPAFGNIRANNGHISFRYKVSKRVLAGSKNDILFYIIPCGGIVYVEIRHKKQVIIPPFKVHGYGKFFIRNPTRGDRYVIRISVLSAEELAYFKNVEVFATMRPRLFPLPDLPAVSDVREVVNKQDCSSTIISWLPVQSNNLLPVVYCVYVNKDNEPPISSVRATKIDQCNLETRLKKSRKEYTLIQCNEVAPLKNATQEVITQKLKLEPDYYYTIQVIATKKGHHHSLSYDLLRMHKNNSCL